MDDLLNRGNRRMWSLKWVVILRLVVYAVMVGFIVQYMYFGSGGGLYRPRLMIAVLAGISVLNLLLFPLVSNSRHVKQLIVASYLLDLVVITLVILTSGGFGSIFVPYYLPVLIMAPAWLPRRYTAIFPSVATLGAAAIGTIHLLGSANHAPVAAAVLPRQLVLSLKNYPGHSVVVNMLILTLLFFVVSYISGYLGKNLMLEQRLNSEILLSMRDGVAVVDGKGVLVYANSEFFNIFPEASGEIDFWRIADGIFHSPDERRTLELLMRERNLDSFMLTRERDPYVDRPPFEMRVSALSLWGEDNVYGIVLLVTDLSLRRRAETAERDLERFSGISTMAAGLAHEIRNPLASLRSAMQEIGEAFPEGSPNRVLTDVAMSESDRLDGVIGRFLDFSRESRLFPTPVRLAPLLETVKTLIMKSGRDIEVRLTVRDDPTVICDADRIKEVFLNLALNASQAVSEKGGVVNIELSNSTDRLASGVEILFKDNGHGIAPEDLSHLFEPFFSRREGGTGMGLSISRKQIEMHGGDISAANLLGGGACFAVWLPLKARDSVTSGRSYGTRVYRIRK